MLLLLSLTKKNGAIILASGLEDFQAMKILP